jgi:hypothetical protein
MSANIRRGRNSRRKGAAFEREVARLLGEATPGAECRRGIQGQGRGFGGEVVADVQHPVLWVECKTGAQPNMRRALEQAQGAAPPGRWPIGVVKYERGGPGATSPVIVAMALDDFLDLLGEWWQRGVA